MGIKNKAVYLVKTGSAILSQQLKQTSKKVNKGYNMISNASLGHQTSPTLPGGTPPMQKALAEAKDDFRGASLKPSSNIKGSDLVPFKLMRELVDGDEGVEQIKTALNDTHLSAFFRTNPKDAAALIMYATSSLVDSDDDGASLNEYKQTLIDTYKFSETSLDAIITLANEKSNEADINKAIVDLANEKSNLSKAGVARASSTNDNTTGSKIQAALFDGLNKELELDKVIENLRVDNLLGKKPGELEPQTIAKLVRDSRASLNTGSKLAWNPAAWATRLKLNLQEVVFSKHPQINHVRDITVQESVDAGAKFFVKRYFAYQRLIEQAHVDQDIDTADKQAKLQKSLVDKYLSNSNFPAELREAFQEYGSSNVEAIIAEVEREEDGVTLEANPIEDYIAEISKQEISKWNEANPDELKVSGNTLTDIYSTKANVKNDIVTKLQGSDNNLLEKTKFHSLVSRLVNKPETKTKQVEKFLAKFIRESETYKALKALDEQAENIGLSDEAKELLKAQLELNILSELKAAEDKARELNAKQESSDKKIPDRELANDADKALVWHSQAREGLKKTFDLDALKLAKFITELSQDGARFTVPAGSDAEAHPAYTISADLRDELVQAVLTGQKLKDPDTKTDVVTGSGGDQYIHSKKDVLKRLTAINTKPSLSLGSSSEADSTLKGLLGLDFLKSEVERRIKDCKSITQELNAANITKALGENKLATLKQTKPDSRVETQSLEDLLS